MFFFGVQQCGCHVICEPPMYGCRDFGRMFACRLRLLVGFLVVESVFFFKIAIGLKKTLHFWRVLQYTLCMCLRPFLVLQFMANLCTGLERHGAHAPPSARTPLSMVLVCFCCAGVPLEASDTKTLRVAGGGAFCLPPLACLF